jgi:hypothetical protein
MSGNPHNVRRLRWRLRPSGLLGIKRDSDEAANGRREKKCQISNVRRNHGPLRCAEQTISFTSIVQTPLSYYIRRRSSEAIFVATLNFHAPALVESRCGC